MHQLLAVGDHDESVLVAAPHQGGSGAGPGAQPRPGNIVARFVGGAPPALVFVRGQFVSGPLDPVHPPAGDHEDPARLVAGDGVRDLLDLLVAGGSAEVQISGAVEAAGDHAHGPVLCGDGEHPVGGDVQADDQIVFAVDVLFGNHVNVPNLDL